MQPARFPAKRATAPIMINANTPDITTALFFCFIAILPWTRWVVSRKGAFALGLLMEQKDLRLKTDLSSGIVYPCDREAMNTVLSNLIDNAINFSPEGGRMDVRAHSERDAIHFSISNTFPPIPQEDLKNIFEPFYRRSGPKAEGYGLGLAIFIRR